LRDPQFPHKCPLGQFSPAVVPPPFSVTPFLAIQKTCRNASTSFCRSLRSHIDNDSPQYVSFAGWFWFFGWCAFWFPAFILPPVFSTGIKRVFLMMYPLPHHFSNQTTHRHLSTLVCTAYTFSHPSPFLVCPFFFCPGLLPIFPFCNLFQSHLFYSRERCSLFFPFCDKPFGCLPFPLTLSSEAAPVQSCLA